MNYGLTDRLTLGAGLRYFEDEREERISGQAGSFDSVNPRVYMQYKLTDEVNTYASAAKGFRSGGFNFVGEPAFDPETIWTYEVGTKMSLLGGRLSADVALFYTDYTELQINGLDPGTLTDFRVRNAGDVKIKGIEWAFLWRPADPWNLSFNGNYVDSEFDEINAVVTSHVVGDPVDNFPEYGYTISAQREFNWNGKSGFARVDYNQQGRMSFRNRSVGPWFSDESDVIDMLNFHVNLRWNNSLSLALYAQNLLDDRGFTSSGHSFDGAPRSRPRTIGIEFGVVFD